MDLAQLIRLTELLSVLLLVFALGLRATLADTTYLFRRPGRLLRALLAIYVVVPVVAALVAAALDRTPAVRITILAMAVSPVPPILPGKQLSLGGRARYAYGLLVAASLAAIVMVPLGVAVLGRLFRHQASIGIVTVAQLVGVTVLVPVLAGLVVGRLRPRLAERVAAWASRFGSILLVAGLLPILVTTGPGVLSLIGNGTILAIAAVVGAGLAAGHWLGGPDPDDRTALAIAAAMRHPGVGLAVAQANFPDAPLTPAAVFLFVLVGVIETSPYGAWRVRMHAARRGRTGRA